MVVAVAAAIGVVFGLLQLGRIAQENANQGNIARAELMLEIDERFEGSEMRHSRLAIRTLRNHCEKKARTVLRAGANDEEVMERSATLFQRKFQGSTKDSRQPIILRQTVSWSTSRPIVTGRTILP
ncbi:hypothetical protein [uncultured Sphingomonas sp.]|uniref:hypothetical protein n=1 Tax=uncultured Sphingomonas sp. TaxID=158754 RepID=UPI0035C9D53C